MNKIAIVEYGVGNVFSLSSSLKYLGIHANITNKKEDIEEATHIFLPGVGAFGDAMEKLNNTGLVPVLSDAIKNGKPLMGICLGMQLLFESSNEYGEHTGLGYLKGNVSDIKTDMSANGFSYKVPHMGWNNLIYKNSDNALLKYINENDSVYFVHSFYAKNCDKSLIATSEYGIEVPAIVANENVYGCQFHPEKSGKVGLNILKAFIEL